MDIAIKNNQIELSCNTESVVIHDIMKLCKIKHYHIINEDLILPYEKRTFIDGNGNRIYLDSNTNTFKSSSYFWNNSPTTYKPKIIVLDYKPSFNKLNALLGMLDSYNHLSKFNFIPFNKLIKLGE